MAKQILTITLEDIVHREHIELNCSLKIDAMHEPGSVSEIVATAFKYHYPQILTLCMDTADDIARLNARH